MPATLLGNPAITPPNITANNYGDPLSKVIDGDSLGEGLGTGIGNGNGGGLGPKRRLQHRWRTSHGRNRRLWEFQAASIALQPQFSDEAVKAKYQGTVLLVAVITADGRATDIHVSKGLGLGLDEKAVEAVRTWRFRPALGPDGKPATVRQTIEVTLPPVLIRSSPAIFFLLAASVCGVTNWSAGRDANSSPKKLLLG